MHIPQCMTKGPCQPRLKSNYFLTFLLQEQFGVHYKDILFIEAIDVSIKTCITSLVAKRSCQLSHTMVFLNNLSKSIINEEATILFQVLNGALTVFFAINLSSTI